MDSYSRAERRVKEMNLLAQQYLEQGNRYMKNRMAQPRFEPAAPSDLISQNILPENLQQSNQQNNFVHNQKNIHSNNLQTEIQPDLRQNNIRHNQQNIQQNNLPHNQHNFQPPPPPPPEPCNNMPVNEHKSGGFLSICGLNDEKLIIMLILVLLVNEKADIKIILALGYLLI